MDNINAQNGVPLQQAKSARYASSTSLGWR
jgi:hypothetical protein